MVGPCHFLFKGERHWRSRRGLIREVLDIHCSAVEDARQLLAGAPPVFPHPENGRPGIRPRNRKPALAPAESVLTGIVI